MSKNKEEDDSSHESELDANTNRMHEKFSPNAKKTDQQRKQAEDSSDNVEDTSNISGGRTKRRVAQCVVEGCTINENSTKSNGKKYQMFDPPKEKSGRLRWSLYVPGVDCAVHMLRYSKVCETHFVDGEPTKENPLPTQNLHPSDEFGLSKNEHDSKKSSKNEHDTKKHKSNDDTMTKSEGEDEKEQKQTLKIKFPAQKSKKFDNMTSPPAKKPKIMTIKSAADSHSIHVIEKSATQSSPSFQQNTKSESSSLTSLPQPSALSVSVSSILKEAISLSKPASSSGNIINRSQPATATVRPTATASVVKLPTITNARSVKQQSAPTLTPQSSSVPRFSQNERSFWTTRPTLKPSISNDDTDDRTMEPCQHCGLELVEIRRDLVRVENKVDVVTTLLRSVLQRTLPAPRPSTSIVKISPTTTTSITTAAANVKQNSAVEAAAMSSGKSNVAKKNVLGKPMKLIINSHGQITHAPANDATNNVNTIAEEETNNNSSSNSTTAKPDIIFTRPNLKQQRPQSSDEIESKKIAPEKLPTTFKLLNNAASVRSKNIANDEDDSESEEDDDDDAPSKAKANIVAKQKIVSNAATMKKNLAKKESESFDESTNDDDEHEVKNETAVDDEIEMSQAVARAALLFTGRGVTINHLKEYGPTWLSGVSQDEVQNVLDELVADGLLEVLGESKINWPNPTSKSALTMEVYRKLPPNEVDESKLLLYGVTKRSYLTSYKQKTSKFTSQLNKLCEEID